MRAYLSGSQIKKKPCRTSVSILAETFYVSETVNDKETLQ